MEFEVLRPSDLRPARLERWAELQVLRPELGSPFLSPQWARAVDRAWPQGGLRVLVIRARGEDVGFLPYRVKGEAAMPAGAPMCDYQGLVALPGLDLEASELVRAMGVARFDFSHWLGGLAPFDAHAQGHECSRVVDLSLGYDAYVAERRAAGITFAKSCERKKRKVEKDVGPVRLVAGSRSGQAFDRLIELKRAQYRATRQTDVLAKPWTRELLRGLRAGRDPAFGGHLSVLYFGDALAAAQFNLRGRDTLHCWIIAHEPAFERYSPGMLLFHELLRWMPQTPFRRLDLGAGDYRFKLELANAAVPVAHGTAGRLSAAFMMRATAYRLRAAAEALPLGGLSTLPGKAMRRIDRWRALS